MLIPIWGAASSQPRVRNGPERTGTAFRFFFWRPERRSGSFFGGVPVFFSAAGTPFLLKVINLVPTNRSGLPKQYFGNTRLTLHALSSQHIIISMV
jgi:hypothetical protein